MKKFFTNLFAAIAIFGLLLSGADSSNQVITCTAGVCLFASGFYGIAYINQDYTH